VAALLVARGAATDAVKDATPKVDPRVAAKVAVRDVAATDAVAAVPSAKTASQPTRCKTLRPASHAKSVHHDKTVAIARAKVAMRPSSHATKCVSKHPKTGPKWHEMRHPAPTTRASPVRDVKVVAAAVAVDRADEASQANARATQPRNPLTGTVHKERWSFQRTLRQTPPRRALSHQSATK
jgi:hypothetical protein